MYKNIFVLCVCISTALHASNSIQRPSFIALQAQGCYVQDGKKQFFHEQGLRTVFNRLSPYFKEFRDSASYDAEKQEDTFKGSLSDSIVQHAVKADLQQLNLETDYQYQALYADGSSIEISFDEESAHWDYTFSISNFFQIDTLQSKGQLCNEHVVQKSLADIKHYLHDIVSRYRQFKYQQRAFDHVDPSREFSYKDQNVIFNKQGKPISYEKRALIAPGCLAIKGVKEFEGAMDKGVIVQAHCSDGASIQISWDNQQKAWDYLEWIFPKKNKLLRL